MERIRIASVAYLNAAPYAWGLSHGTHRDRFDVSYVPPCEAARRLAEGLVDVALIPSIEFARTAGLRAVPGLGIASLEEVRSVLLLSRVPVDAIRSIGVDENSRTSVALLRVLLKRRYRCSPKLVSMPPDPDRILDGHDAALLIGDAALSASRIDSFGGTQVRRLDLASEWYAMTRLPFVFAFWACRPVVDAGTVGTMLGESLQQGMRNLEAIARDESERTGLPADLIGSYLQDNIKYRLGATEVESLRIFFGICRDQGVLAGADGYRASSSSSSTAKSG